MMTYEEALNILKELKQTLGFYGNKAQAFEVAEQCIMICDQMKAINILINSR